MSGPALARRLGLGDAVVIGLGSMLGAGVFVALGPAAAAAGSALLPALAVAALVAFCNATSSAQLAAQYPTSGGAYVYGRERLGPWYGFLAGWGFVIGKTASCAAMALTFASYAAPPALERPVAVAAVLALVGVNLRGITRTALVTRVLLVVVLLVLALVVVSSVAGGAAQADRLGGLGDLRAAGARGVLEAAGLLFFAFAGYARIATLGEEVRRPQVTIPRAVVLALGLALVVYVATAVAVLGVLGADRLADSLTPLADAVEAGSWSAAAPAVRAGAVAASLGALLGLVAGVARTALAMARTGDLPGWLADVHPVHQVPHHAELALGAAVTAVVLVADVRGAIGFSSFGVLLYYLVANVAALTQAREHRRYPRVVQVVGGLGCAVLVLSLPASSVVTGVAVLAAGVAYRAGRLRRSRA